MEFNRLIPHVDFSNNSTKSNQSIGSYIFSGNNYFGSGNYVGLQVGDDVDKWQLTDINGLQWRQNDSGGSNASWGTWKTIVDSSNYSNYLTSNNLETITGRIYRETINPSSSTTYTIYPNKEYILNNISNNTTINLVDPSNSFPNSTYAPGNNANIQFIYQGDSLQYVQNIYIIKFRITATVNISFNKTIIWNGTRPSFVYQSDDSYRNRYEICITYDRSTNTYYGIYLNYDNKTVANDIYSFNRSNYYTVNLGRPSGTLWTNMDIILDRNDGVKRDLFEYGRVLDDYNNNTKPYGVSSNHQLSLSEDLSYDVSNGDFCIPTEEQFIELFSKCTITSYTDPYLYFRFTGPNGNYIDIRPDRFWYGVFNDGIRYYYNGYDSNNINSHYNLQFIFATNAEVSDGIRQFNNGEILATNNFYKILALMSGDYHTTVHKIRAVAYNSSNNNYIPYTKTINLNSQWRTSTSYGNLVDQLSFTSSFYSYYNTTNENPSSKCPISYYYTDDWDFYESNSNHNIASSISQMIITIKGCRTFEFYIRSYGENNYDYVVIFLDNNSITTSNWNKTTTSGYITSTKGESSATDWKKVTITNLNVTTTHTIRIVYGKDGSNNGPTGSTDRGYLAILKDSEDYILNIS